MTLGNSSIVFIFPPQQSDYEFRHHLGAGYIQAYLSERGISSSQYVPEGGVTLSSFAHHVVEQGNEFVGFTCYDTNYYMVKSIAQRIKKENPAIMVLAGGPTATFSDSLILNDCPQIDICVRGEGEETTYALVENNLSDLHRIEGISFREGKSIVRTKDRRLIGSSVRGSELDVLPSPYLKEVLPPDGRAGISTSRGCVYRCTYCNSSAMFGHTVRHHSIDRVLDELRRIDSHFDNNPNLERSMVTIQDDTFSLDLNRAKQLCQRVIDEGIDLEMYARTRADHCDAELLTLMYGAGIRIVDFGLESSCPRILRNIKRVYAGGEFTDYGPEKRFLSKLKENVKIAGELGFITTLNVITGLPGETLKDARGTLRFVSRLKVDRYTHSYLRILAGTELSSTYKKYGLGLRKSSMILPYQTIYPYDVSAVKPLDHATVVSQIQRYEIEYLEALSNNSNKFDDRSHLSILTDSLPGGQTFHSWLANAATIPFTLFFLGDQLTHESATHHVKEFVEHGIPIGRYLYKVPLGKQRNSYGLAIFGSERKTPGNLPFFSFIEIPLSEHGKSHRLCQKTIPVFTLEDKDDIVSFIQLTKKAKKSNYLLMENVGPLAIRDECRWAGEPCPALDCRRMVVNDKSVTPCFNARIIGNLTSDLEETKAHLGVLWREERLRRGCTTCRVKERCSMCLFPFPLTPEEYCRLRKNNPLLAQYVNLIRVSRILLDASIDDIELLKDKRNTRIRICIKGSREKRVHFASSSLSNLQKAMSREEIELVFVNDSPYVVNKRTSSIYEANRATAQVLEAVMCNQDLSQIVEKFLKEYDTNEKQIIAHIQKALEVFDAEGFLEWIHDRTHA